VLEPALESYVIIGNFIKAIRLLAQVAARAWLKFYLIRIVNNNPDQPEVYFK